MPSTRDIRRRIKSVKSTSLITKAMQMVAASKMSKAQEQAMQGRPFALQLEKMLKDIGANALEVEHPLWKNKGLNDRPCVLLISTDKGLCGGLNANLFREVNALPKETAFVTIGRRGKQFLARSKRNLLADFELGEKVMFTEVKKVSEYLTDLFLKGEITSLNVVYSQFVNTLVQKPSSEPLLPLADLSITDAGLLGVANSKNKEAAEEAPAPAGDVAISNIDAGFIYEPSEEAVESKLFPTYVNFQVYHMLLEARASEHSARMVAMKNATDNAKQLIKDLTLEYNKVRQSSITNEILEIAAAQMASN
ncbi:MAG: ATP synthase F1 subunit gamma [Verrucomicrobiales bacterium]|jgi:F-type H+-transporting ATPase subunit gamma|nr:ATP synthase F1 subunit gamma [Verrucomicrobiales bacterium]